MASWSATGSINSNYRLELNVWEAWTDNANNYSRVNWEVKLVSTGGYSFSTIGSTVTVNVDGQVYNEYSQKDLSAYGTITIASGYKNIWHNSDGSKSINCSASYTQTATAYYTPGNMSCGGWMDLTHIPRYTNFTQHYVSERTMNSIKVYWATDAARDWTQYSLNGGGWTNASDSVAGDNKSGSYVVSNLTPNTTYTIKTRVKRADSQLWSESGTITTKTLDMARFSNFNSTFKLGEEYEYTYTNPSNAKVEIGIYETDGNTPIVEYKEYSNSSGEIELTDNEIKIILEKMKNNNEYLARMYIRSTKNNNSSWNGQDITIKLTGKIKTSIIFVNGVNKKGIVWIGTPDGNKAGVFTVGTANGNRRGM